MALIHKKNLKVISAIIVSSIVFLIAVVLDITPLLRGPAPYPPEWQYTYLFINTLNKIWAPFIIGIIIFIFLFILEKKNVVYVEKKEKLIIILVIILSFLFQISILYFSRAGMGVMLQRILDPGMNGYFTVSLEINDTHQFLKNYNDSVLSYTGHARGHPPGGILFYDVVNNFFSFTPFLYYFVENLTSHKGDIQSLWSLLNNSQKLGAFLSGFIISFLSNFVLIPLYYLGKHLYDIRTGLRSIFLFVFVPSFILYIPMHDVFFVLFSISSTFLFIKGLDIKSYRYLLFSGLILSFGLFFSLSLFPILLAFFILFISYLFKKRDIIFNKWLGMALHVLFGLFLLPFVLYVLFDFNSIAVGITIMSGIAPRSYFLWLFYNIYDFFIFSGIPLFVLFSLITKKYIFDILKKKWSNIDLFFITFFITLIILNISGACRAETSRIWLILTPYLVILVSKFMTQDLKFSRLSFLIVIFIQFIQILVFQEFWVMLW